MDKNLPESLKEIYRSLPLPIREAIFAPETTDAYDRAQEHHNLTKEQREILSIQCGLLMMGLILPQDLVPILTRELKLPQQKVSLIAQDINREVFNPIKNELKEIHVLDSGAADIIAPKTAAAQPLPSSSPLPQTAPVVSPKPAPTQSVPPPLPQTHPLSPPLAAPSQSIFEQKMGGTFRLKSDTTSHVGAGASPATAPSAVMPNPATPPKVDPYRETP